MTTRRAFEASRLPDMATATRPRPKVDAGRAPHSSKARAPAFELTFMTSDTKRWTRGPERDLGGAALTRNLSSSCESLRDAMTQAPAQCGARHLRRHTGMLDDKRRGAPPRHHGCKASCRVNPTCRLALRAEARRLFYLALTLPHPLRVPSASRIRRPLYASHALGAQRCRRGNGDATMPHDGGGCSHVRMQPGHMPGCSSRTRQQRDCTTVGAALMPGRRQRRRVETRAGADWTGGRLQDSLRARGPQRPRAADHRRPGDGTEVATVE